MKIPHTTFKQYIEGINREEVNYILKYGIIQPEDLFNVGDIMNRTFEFVKDLQHLYNKQGADWEKLFKFLFKHGITDDSIYNQSVYKVHAFRIWLKERVDFINKLESDNLGHAPTGDEISAGIDNFNIFDHYPQFRSLADGGDYNKIEQVKQWPYDFCFMEMKYKSVMQEYERQLTNIRMKKNK